MTLFLIITTLLTASPRLHVENMKCENLTDPLAVDVSNPRLSWWNVAEPGDTDQRQTAYQIQVASSPLLLEKGKPDLWDSKKQKSDAETLIAYQGRQLTSRQDCYWRMRVWDKRARRSAWSETGRWRMGLLNQDDWKAQWIKAPEEWSAPLFRKNLNIRKNISNAHIYICGLGYFELYVDGEKVGNDVLVPNQTDYSFRPNIEHTRVAIDNEFSGYRCFYLGYDLTAKLTAGQHVVGVMLGNGFYNSGNAFAMRYGHPRLIAQLYLTYSDGTSEMIPTDGSWLTKPGPITMNGIYAGEHYDARNEDDAWCRPERFVPSEWQQASPAQAPDGRLEAQTGPSDTVAEVFRPQKIDRQADGSVVVDFCEEISGWVCLRNIKGKAGQQIRIDYLSESPNGESVYTLRGTGRETYRPRFTWFVFRRVRISGLTQPITTDDITAEAVNTELRTTGTFACSDTLLTKIYQIWRRTLLDNAHGSIISDCPHRERAAYLGDGQVAAPMVMKTFDARALYRKWFADMRLAQNPRTGFVPFGAPWQPGCGGGVPWSAAMVLMPYEYYLHYGDKQVLEENYPAMLRLMDYFSQWVSEDGTMEQHYQPNNDMAYWCNLGEWCTPTDVRPSNALVHTYYYWRCAKAMNEISVWLGRDKEAEQFDKLEVKTRIAMYQHLFDEEKYTYGPAGSNIFALDMMYWGQDDTLEDVVEQELADHNGHLYTGIYGTSLFFNVLAEHGMARQALEAFRKTDFPSFGYWIRQGATTTWEQWDGGNSHCHPMFGGGLTWLYTWLGGIQYDGTKTIIIAPQLPEDISWVECSQENNYGLIHVRTERQADESIRLSVTIPVGCTAEICDPFKEDLPVTVGSGTREFTYKSADARSYND